MNTWYKSADSEEGGKIDFIKRHITGFVIGVAVVVTFGAIWQSISFNQTVEELGKSVGQLTTISISANSKATNNEKQLGGVIGFLNNEIAKSNAVDN